MGYKNLKKVFHMFGEQNLENEYQTRQKSFTTFSTHVEIHPIRDKKQCQTVSYPLFICMSKTLTHKMEHVLLNSNKILKLSYAQPPIALQSYLDKLLINELQSTNEKENVRSTKAELAEILNNHQGKKNKKFQGLVKQYQMLGNAEIKIKEVSDFRIVYDMLLSHDIGQEQQPDGKNFRTEGVGVYDNAMGKWIHRNDFDEVKINDFLNKLLVFQNDESIPYLIRMAAAHYMFEYLHPFYDGNGRLGRYLIAKMLHEVLDPITALTFSYTVNRNKTKYDKAFANASEYFNKGELTEFVETMFDLIIEGQESALEEMQISLVTLQRLEKGLKQLDLSQEAYQFLFVLIQDKIFGSPLSRITLPNLTEVLNVSRHKVNGLVEEHHDKLTQIKKRPAVYEIKDTFIEQLLSTEIERKMNI